MDRLTAVKIKLDNDSTYSSEIPIGVLAENIALKSGKSLEKTLEDIQAGIAGSQSDWNQEDPLHLGYIENKPAIKAGQGENSIIEGKLSKNIAFGQYSHAEGGNTTASGGYSHAEGGETTASSGYSHAEGQGTRASGNRSHAEGYGTTASNDGAHAEGHGTTASGAGSHSEGAGSSALGPYCHAEGASTVAGAATTNVTGAHAEGYQSKALSDFTHAEGNNVKAQAQGAHVEGNDTIASSDYQHVQGKHNIEDTNGTYAHIVGNGTSDSERSNAHTLDWSGNAWYAGKVTTEGTPTEDNDLVPKSYVDSKIIDDLADYATMDWIEDKGFIVNETQSDWNGTDEYDASFIQNKPAIKSGTGQNSIVEGDIQANIASGYYSHAEGLSTKAYADFSHAEGGDTEAVVDYSHAEGQGSRASGYRTHAEGYQTEAMGDSSHSEGYYTLASGQGSHAEGGNTIAAGTYQHVQGKYNIQDTENKYLHIVGNGTDANHRSNAHTLDQSGNAWFSGKVTAEGTPTGDNDLVSKAWVEGKDYITGLALMEYGTSTWEEVAAAINANKVVYCKASSGTSGQWRYAFLAYTNMSSATKSAEFQYYRSVKERSATQQGDQVFVYTITSKNGGTWSTVTREAISKIAVGEGLELSYINGTLTISLSAN